MYGQSGKGKGLYRLKGETIEESGGGKPKAEILPKRKVLKKEQTMS